MDTLKNIPEGEAEFVAEQNRLFEQGMVGPETPVANSIVIGGCGQARELVMAVTRLKADIFYMIMDFEQVYERKVDTIYVHRTSVPLEGWASKSELEDLFAKNPALKAALADRLDSVDIRLKEEGDDQ